MDANKHEEVIQKPLQIGAHLNKQERKEMERDNQEIQDSLLIPYRPNQFLYGKVATKIKR
ncbi:hypothetical protein GO730_05635 [Spirosoma sp. HMF3257]|uniref:Uncharacterized protein n=1 Tax=Spirosoma telluris TaxID=2183553 RepID=A0A327NFM2_9BACT|nr:hypothetical protein [Spirosoma telluris]RAI73957.1 hypothetical protein HMF3257_05595 [Spirosoma telluris]